MSFMFKYSVVFFFVIFIIVVTGTSLTFLKKVKRNVLYQFCFFFLIVIEEGRWDWL